MVYHPCLTTPFRMSEWKNSLYKLHDFRNSAFWPRMARITRMNPQHNESGLSGIRVVCAIRGKLFVLIPRLNDAVGQGIISGNYYEGSS